MSLSACADVRGEQAAMAPPLFVGMPKQTLLTCAGVPDRSATVDNQEFFTYESRRIASYPASSFGFYGARYAPGYGYGLGYGYPWYGYDVVDLSCEATFTLRNGTVEKLIYGGGSQLGQCYRIVENCLAAAGQQPRVPGTAPTPQQTIPQQSVPKPSPPS